MSPFVWRIRFALNIKGLKHTTEWLNYGKLEEELKERKGTPTRFLPDGTPVYTVPAIHDHSTNTTLSDSERILKYLDDAYPDTPQLTTSSHMVEEPVKQAFDSMWPLPLSALMLSGLWGLMVPVIIKHIDEASARKYRSRFEAKTGVTVESLLEEDKRLELKTKARASLKEADRQLEEIVELCGGEGPWLLGKEAKLPDLAVGGTLAYVAAVLGEDSELWREIRQWDAGRWGDRWDEIKPYHKLY